MLNRTQEELWMNDDGKYIFICVFQYVFSFLSMHLESSSIDQAATAL